MSSRTYTSNGRQYTLESRDMSNFPAQPNMTDFALTLIEKENIDFEQLKKDYERRQKERKAKEAEEERKKAEWRRKHEKKENDPLYRLRIEFWPYRHIKRRRKAMRGYLNTLSTEELRRTLGKLDAMESMPYFRSEDARALSGVILSHIEQRHSSTTEKRGGGLLSHFRLPRAE